MKITLKSPDITDKEAALDYIREHHEHGEPRTHGDGRLNKMYPDYEGWLDFLESELHEETLEPGRVINSTYFGVDENGRILGMANIRHYMNEELLKVSGHIGAGVRPTARNKGVASVMCRIALERCKDLGIDRALITCNNDNHASRAVILKNGGVLENEFLEDNGNTVERYWIDLR